MFKDEYQAVCNAGAAKSNLLKKNPVGYFVAAMVAGMFISFGSFVAFTLGQVISCGDAACWTKLSQAFAFAAALSLVIMAGSELFTGNNFVMCSAAIRKTVSWADTIKLWVVCWIGNLVGSLLSVLVFQLSGIPTASEGVVADYFIKISEGKVGLGPVELISRAILCNILVCLAVWCGIKMKSESGKLIMIFWCIIVFMICGFEHSVANMSIVGVGVANGGISIGQYFYSVLMASLGNVIGGAVFVALPYHLISKEK
ncbi:MAG: formate/nitrite transporter family protein [Clostridia bacterium]|nr:formate/nitrite transporter family protein [Clostridia bacterium]NCC43231.1 formate/nitrite transporter family protein [Clostridia bacterium]